MPTADTVERARYIFTTGKLIHDRILRIQADLLALEGKRSAMGELSVAQIHVLSIIRQNGRVSMTELANLLGVSPPSASAMVDRLVEKKLLTRESNPEDRRKVVVSVTDMFMEAVGHLEDAILQSFVDLVDRLGPDAARQWCDVLGKVKQVLDVDPENATGVGCRKN
mgnify:CR=1 FL=1